MTTTPELHELARDPQAFDIVLAELHGRRDGYAQTVSGLVAKLHDMAGDKKRYRGTRVPVWGMSDREAEQEAQRLTAHGDDNAVLTVQALGSTRAMLTAIDFEIANMGAVYALQGNRWTRFFPSVTKSQPHIHRSLNCRTLHATTVMTWAPQLSGRTDAEAVAELDEALCSVCFPDAPVALHNYVSKRSQAEQDARQLVKDEAAAKKAAKQLTADEQFKTTGRFSDRITTVAACKELIRKHVEAEVELEWILSDDRIGWVDAETLERMRINRRDRVLELEKDSARAQTVLIARELAHEGWGMSAVEIGKMVDRKRASATKEWAKN